MECKKKTGYHLLLFTVIHGCFLLHSTLVHGLGSSRVTSCAGNSLLALNDVTAMELPDIVAEAAKHCDILRGAAEARGLLVDAMSNIQDGYKEDTPSVPLMVVENRCGSPCIDLRQASLELAAAAKDADLVILEGMGRSLHTNYNVKVQM